MADAVRDALAVGVKIRDEAGSKGWWHDSNAWVRATEEVGIDPGMFPLGSREVVLIREPSFVPAVDAVLLPEG